MMFHTFPSEASIATVILKGPARVESFRISSTKTSAVSVKVYISPAKDRGIVQEGHALFPATSLTATITDNDPFDVLAGWTMYAWCDTAHGASFWVMTGGGQF